MTLTLRFTESDLSRLGPRHLAYGFLVTWVVGLGRYWDHPDPYLVQAIGVGSLLVMGGLGLLLYGLLWPLRPARWSLLHLYTFLSLTALPALLYAIPVERFLSLGTARSANVWLLATVALWRVAMLGRYLARRTDISGGLLFLALLLPLALVVLVLTALNLEQAVFNIMAGVREEEGTADDSAYQILFLISAASIMSAPVLLLAYGIAIWRRWRPRREAA